MKTGLHQTLRGIVCAFLLTAVYSASAFYDPTIGRWASRDPIGEQGFEKLTQVSLKAGKGMREVNLYGFINNSPVADYDYLGLVAGIGNGGRACSISPSQAGRVTFSGFSSDTLADFRLINESGATIGSPNSGGASEHVDGFWWKGYKDHWFKIPGFCTVLVEPEFSEDGFSVKWCCNACTKLGCEFFHGIGLYKQPCRPGFVPNSGHTAINRYPWE